LKNAPTIQKKWYWSGVSLSTGQFSMIDPSYVHINMQLWKCFDMKINWIWQYCIKLTEGRGRFTSSSIFQWYRHHFAMVEGVAKFYVKSECSVVRFWGFLCFFYKQNVCLCVYRKYKIATSKGHLKALTLIGTLNKMNTYFYQKLGIWLNPTCKWIIIL
jgi:hypothetical protein